MGVANSNVVLGDVSNMDQPPRINLYILHRLSWQQVLDVTTTKEFLDNRKGKTVKILIAGFMTALSSPRKQELPWVRPSKNQ